MCTQSCRNKTYEKKVLKKQNTPGNKRWVKGKHPLFPFFCVDGHVETKIMKKSIEKQNTGNKRQVNGKHSLSLSQLVGQLDPVKARKLAIIENLESFQK